MKGINRVILMGYLGSKPKAQLTQKGHDVAFLNLATHRSRKNSEGQWVNQTDWHRITVWGNLAKTCTTHLNKGQLVAIQGYLSPKESEDLRGTQKTEINITAEEVEFGPSRPPATGPGF